MQTRAEAGDPQAQLRLAQRLRDGEGTSENGQRAAEWFRKAADQGSVEAMAELGCLYASGNGVAMDLAEALRWCGEAASRGDAHAQWHVGLLYLTGEVVTKDLPRAARIFRKSAAQGYARAQNALGIMLLKGEGLPANPGEALALFHLAAEQGFPSAFNNIGSVYEAGSGVAQDLRRAARWYAQAAERGNAIGQTNLAMLLAKGVGVPRDDLQAYRWAILAAATGEQDAASLVEELAKRMGRAEVAQAQRLAREFVPTASPRELGHGPGEGHGQSSRSSVGTGFLISTTGHIATCYHVVAEAKTVHVLTRDGLREAAVAGRDEVGDLAILKIAGSHPCLPVVSSAGVMLGATVATVGFPNPDLLGVAPKLSKGEIASLSGVMDDPLSFQVSLPVQPGNSGGPLFDAEGNVVGVVAARLSETAARASTGHAAENVNYAIKSDRLLALMREVPALAPQSPAPLGAAKFEDIVRVVEGCAVIVVTQR